MDAAAQADRVAADIYPGQREAAGAGLENLDARKTYYGCVNEQVNWRTHVAGLSANEPSPLRLFGALLIETDED